MDSLRPDFLGCYGYNRETSPNIDKLAQESVLFRNAFAQATWTRPSGASLLTGYYPSAHGLLMLSDQLQGSVPLLPEYLNAKGFRTVALSTIGNISPSFGFERGFDHFVELYKEPTVIERRRSVDIEKMGWGKSDFEGVGDCVPLATSEDINENIFPYLEANGSKDLFVLAWSLDTHDPYFHRDPQLSKFSSQTIGWSYREVKEMIAEDELFSLKAMYSDMIYYNDHHLGKLIERLQSLGCYDETLLILTGDHGEAFGEHGFTSHGREPYDELIRVPLIIKFPHGEFTGKVFDLVQHIDIVPTILDYLGRGEGTNVGQGQSLLPLLKGQRKGAGFIFSEYQLGAKQPRYYTLRTHDYKYVEARRGDFTLREWIDEKENIWPLTWFVYKPRWLYSLNNDPSENTDVYRSVPDVGKNLHRKVKTILKESRRLLDRFGNGIRPNNRVDDQVASQLRALGYYD